MVKQPILLSDVAYIENDAWWGWAFAPGGFVLGPSILFALHILGQLAFDLVAKEDKEEGGRRRGVVLYRINIHVIYRSIYCTYHTNWYVPHIYIYLFTS